MNDQTKMTITPERLAPVPAYILRSKAESHSNDEVRSMAAELLRLRSLEAAVREAGEAIGNHAFASSDKHLSGYRLTLGFDTLEQVQAAHTAAVIFGKALKERT